VASVSGWNADGFLAQEWQRTYHEASVALEGREGALAGAAEALERDLQLLGATAVEDRLQEGVPQAIACLLAAGLKVRLSCWLRNRKGS